LFFSLFIFLAVLGFNLRALRLQSIQTLLLNGNVSIYFFHSVQGYPFFPTKSIFKAKISKLMFTHRCHFWKLRFVFSNTNRNLKTSFKRTSYFFNHCMTFVIFDYQDHYYIFKVQQSQGVTISSIHWISSFIRL
jgi:hypothetical protein